MEALVGAGGRDAASSATVLATMGHDIDQTGNQRNEMLVRHLPNEIKANISVAVDEAMAHAYDLPPRDIGIASFRIGGDLAGRLTKYSSERMTAFWCRRLVRKAVSLRSLMKERASLAANSMSSRSAASRSGKSAIDCLGVS